MESVVGVNLMVGLITSDTKRGSLRGNKENPVFPPPNQATFYSETDHFYIPR